LPSDEAAALLAALPALEHLRELEDVQRAGHGNPTLGQAER
jgi:hypothetical protein